MQATIKIISDADFTPDFLRQLANEIEASEAQDGFTFETKDGCAEVVYNEE